MFEGRVMYRRRHITVLAPLAAASVAGCSSVGGPDLAVEEFQIPETVASAEELAASVVVRNEGEAPVETDVTFELTGVEESSELDDVSRSDRISIDVDAEVTVEFAVRVDLEPGTYEASVNVAGSDDEPGRDVELVEATAETGTESAEE